MYWRYLRFRITWTSPTLFPSTFLPLVVSKPQKPIVFIISCSSGLFPSRSASVTTGFVCRRLDEEDDDDGNGDLSRPLSRSNDRDLKRRRFAFMLLLFLLWKKLKTTLRKKVEQQRATNFHYNSPRSSSIITLAQFSFSISVSLSTLPTSVPALVAFGWPPSFPGKFTEQI